MLCIFLLCLQEGSGELPDNKEISRSIGEMAGLKKVMKKVMPFVQMIRENLVVHGESALDIACRFDQKEVLEQVCSAFFFSLFIVYQLCWMLVQSIALYALMFQNMDYILQTLDLERVIIADTSEANVPSNVVEMTCPGRPVIMYQEEKVTIPYKLNCQISNCFLFWYLDVRFVILSHSKKFKFVTSVSGVIKFSYCFVVPVLSPLLLLHVL